MEYSQNTRVTSKNRYKVWYELKAKNEEWITKFHVRSTKRSSFVIAKCVLHTLKHVLNFRLLYNRERLRSIAMSFFTPISPKKVSIIAIRGNKYSIDSEASPSAIPLATCR